MKFLTRCLSSIASLGLVCGPLVIPASALTLTGTWTGAATCKGGVLDTADPAKPVLTSVNTIGTVTIAASQNGRDLNLSMQVNDQTLTAHGALIEKSDTARSAFVTAVRCGTTVTPVSVGAGSAKFRTDPLTNQVSGKGTIVLGDGVASLVCKLSGLTQSSTVDPQIGACQ
jgi:hypothetical protein